MYTIASCWGILLKPRKRRKTPKPKGFHYECKLGEGSGKSVFTVNAIYFDLLLEYYRGSSLRKKTSISIDENLWREWISFVVDKTGSARKISSELEKAIEEYMERHSGASQRDLNGGTQQLRRSNLEE